MVAFSDLWRYFWKAETRYTVHSPFVFDLLEHVIDDRRAFYDFAALDRLRYLLRRNSQQLAVTDLGAGSQHSKTNNRSIADIARAAVSPRWQAECLFRLVDHLQLHNRLEIGTSLGLTTLYQYLPLRQSPFLTLEGCPNIAAVAQHYFKTFKTQQLELLQGDFKTTLPQALARLKRLDYAFIDGNHRLQPTLDYFEACLNYSHDGTVLVIDDIYWSEEMKAAWKTIQQHPRVTLTIDLFSMGLVFFHKSQHSRQHFTLIPARYKPWKMGFFAPNPEVVEL